MHYIPLPLQSQDEHARLDALTRYEILDTPAEAAFDRLAQLAASIFQTPMALVSLVDQERQWFKACVGVDYRQTDRSLSFCAHALRADDVLVIPDTTQDPRFRDNTLVTGPPHLRFYAGAPLVTSDGHRLGTLCVLDQVPHQALSTEQCQILQQLAASVMSELELRLALIKRQHTDTIHSAMLAASPDGIVTLDTQGVIIEWNPGAERLFGYTCEEVVGRSGLDLIQETLGPEASRQFWMFLQAQPTEQVGRDPVDIVRHRNGRSFPVETTVLPLEVNDQRLYSVTIRDRTEQVAAQQELIMQRNLLQTALDGVPEAMYVKDLHRRYLMVNAVGAALMERPVSAILGRTDEELCAPELAAMIRQQDEQVLDAGELHSSEIQEVLLGSQWRVFRSIKAAYRDGAGQVAGLTGILLDVTEQQAAEAIIRGHNTQLAEQVQDAQLEILERLARAAEYRDDDTGEHMHRVGRTAAGLAYQLGLPEEEIELIRRTAPLHDVGKIGVSDSILLKPGRLTPEEFEVVKRHSQMGAEILRGGRSPLVQMAETIAWTHHERWDGRGYPVGLVGEAIPLVGRIVAVADVLDALTSERPYKRIWSLEAALAEITAQAGRQFDPQVVEALHRLLIEQQDSNL